MGLNLLLIAMMAQPGGGKAFLPLFLEQLIHQPVIFSSIACKAVEDEATEPEREGPLADFPQFII